MKAKLEDSRYKKVEVLPVDGKTDRVYFFIHRNLLTTVAEVDYSSGSPRIIASARDGCWIPIPLNCSCPHMDIYSFRRNQALFQLKLNKRR